MIAHLRQGTVWETHIHCQPDPTKNLPRIHYSICIQNNWYWDKWTHCTWMYTCAQLRDKQSIQWVDFLSHIGMYGEYCNIILQFNVLLVHATASGASNSNVLSADTTRHSSCMSKHWKLSRNLNKSLSLRSWTCMHVCTPHCNSMAQMSKSQHAQLADESYASRQCWASSTLGFVSGTWKLSRLLRQPVLIHAYYASQCCQLGFRGLTTTT